MTTPVSPSSMPVVDYDAPLVNPIGGGLFTVATVIDTAEGQPNRILGGINIWPTNHGLGYGTWDTDPCAAPAEGALKTGQRAVPGEPFDALQVWGFDSCDPREGAEAIAVRALQNVRLHEQTLSEQHYAARLLADSTPVAFPDLIAALSELEVEIGETGTAGSVIHLSRRYMLPLDAAGITLGTGPIHRLPSGTALVFGGGYDDVLGSTIVATGPVTVWRSPVFQETITTPEDNEIASVAERTIVVGHEILIGAVTVTP